LQSGVGDEQSWWLHSIVNIFNNTELHTCNWLK
jgi:hypothetical protein